MINDEVVLAVSVGFVVILVPKVLKFIKKHLEDK